MREGSWRLLCAGLLITALGCASEEPAGYQALDTVSAKGPAVQPGGPSEVWAVENAWLDTDTPAAREAGVAWPADSGLDWEEKFDVWIQSLEAVEGPWGTTFAIATPYGDRQLPAPRLDCGEVAYLMRLAFASWYHLPFYVAGWDAELRAPVYAGHMGFVTRDGQPRSGFPSFRDRYADHEDSWEPGAAWPEDASLREKRLGDDDANRFFDEADGPTGAGAYFDELFLNKRAGHFARLLLLYYGSINLADDSNLFHIEADAIASGDILLRRQKRLGTGHTVPILKVTHPLEGKIAVEVASGNIPRRHPKWEDTLATRSRFTNDQYGGHGENGKGDAYAALGGGIRRWRTATRKGNRWHNVALDEAVRIPTDDLEAIAQRVDRFDEILITGSPEERTAAALTKIDEMRAHLDSHPSSCAARIGREAAFEDLYEVLGTHQGMSRAEVDAEYRTLADYVFAELSYEQSKTCCWNGTTEAMATVVLDYAEQELAEAEADGTCISPTVFRAHGPGDGYEIWRQHAETMGVAWVDWSADETCPQADVTEDTLADTQPTPWCALP